MTRIKGTLYEPKYIRECISVLLIKIFLELQMDMKQDSKYTTQDNTEHKNSTNSQYRNITNTVSEILCV